MRRELLERFERLQVCDDIIGKLGETNQIYIVDHDVPLSVSKGIYRILNARRIMEAKLRNIPEEQYEFEDVLAVLLGLI